MTFSKQSRATSGAGAAARATQAAADPIMLTLCRLQHAVTIKPPKAPQLKPYTFFTSRTRQPDGTELLHLHMGFFATLELAQKWVQVMRSVYPDAVATRAPAALLQKRDAAAPRLHPLPQDVPAGNASLTDTQVLRILETRAPARHDAGEKSSGSGISLLKPDDTNTRRALKEAVVRGAQVSFAVQLYRSDVPFDLSSLPSLSIFRSYTLYATQGKQGGLPWYSLRLGFFSDAISAKQVAHYVRPNFASVAVVPIMEEERERSDERRVDPESLAASGIPQDALHPVSAETSAANVPLAPPDPRESLEQTLELLAASEIWNDEESFSQTGVRHLKVDIQKRS
jgi:hypothetical protein